MAVMGSTMGKSTKLVLGALGLAAAAIPLTSALATAEDPTQAPVAAPAEAAPLTAEQAAASRALFNQYACGACHVLGAAGGSGHIGPQLDGNSGLDHDYIVNRVSNGQGAMPGFGGMIAADQIDQLATYIMQVKQ
jgi:mono/diheme cytochrome c family protein